MYHAHFVNVELQLRLLMLLLLYRPYCLRKISKQVISCLVPHRTISAVLYKKSACLDFRITPKRFSVLSSFRFARCYK